MINKVPMFIDLNRRDISFLTNIIDTMSTWHLDQNIDPYYFIRYISLVVNAADISRRIIDSFSNSKINDLSIYQDLQNLKKKIDYISYSIKVVAERCEYYSYPLPTEVDEPWHNELFDESVNSTFEFIRSHKVMRTDERTAVVNNASRMIFQMQKEYTKMTHGFADVINECHGKLQELEYFIHSLDNDYADILENTYYSFFSESKEDIEDNLWTLIYEKKIVENYSKDPTKAEWGQLLKLKVESLPLQRNAQVLLTVFSPRHPLDIRNPKIIQYIKDNCVIEEDWLLFFHHFAEIAILQSKVKDGFIVLPHEKNEEAKPLPLMVIRQISDDAKLNKMFRDAMAKVAEKTGKTGMKWKWSHVKLVLENEGMIAVVTPTEFGRQMNEINSGIDAENCRKNIENNEIKIPNGYYDKNYYDWPDANTYKTICCSIAAEFKVLKEYIRKNYIQQE